MTSPTDQITYRFRTDERDAVRGLRNMRDGMEDLDRLGKTLAKTQRAEADAAGRLKVAQARLADVRKTGKAKAAQLASAEEAVAKAQRGLVASAGEARSASLQLARAQDRAGDAADRAERKFRGLRRSSDDTGRAFGSVRKNIGGFSLGIGKMLGPLGLATGAAGAVGGGLLALGLNAYKGAAQLQLMDQKARVVFGRSFPQLAAWAKTVAGRMGLTTREVLGLTSGFADMLVPMGFARDQAAKMAQRFSGLIGPLTEWSNGQLDAAGASEALMGALTGEYDTLQRLGIPISAAAVDAEVLRQKQRGVQYATEDQAKAAAALDLIYRGSKDAQSAYARNTGTLASKAAQARARFKEVRDEVLVALIPAFDKLGKWFLDHQDEIISFGFRAARGVIDFGESASLAFAGVLDGIGDTMIGLGKFLAASNATWSGILTGAQITLGAIFPGMRRDLSDAVVRFERFRREAGNDLIDAGNKAKGMADSIKRNVPPAADVARKKLEEVRREALGLPKNPQIKPTTPGADTAIGKMNALTRAANNIPERRVISVIAQISARDASVQASITSRNVTGSGSGRAFGGWVPGHSPGDYSDNIPATVAGRQRLWLTGKEYVVKRPTARKLERSAPGFLDALNAGQVDVAGDRGAMRFSAGRPLGRARGGSVPEVQRFLRGTDPLPYIWGGAGPGGYDCSGLAGAAYGKLTGKGGGSGQRYFTTDTIGAAQGFRRGVGTFTVGVTPGRGHMAMQLGSLKAEARSTAAGILVGPAASSPLSFARKFYLPSLGGTFGQDGLSRAQMRSVVRQIGPQIVKQIVRELGIRKADTGGFLAPGLNPPIFNGTGRPELMTPASTMDAVVALLTRVAKAVETMPAARIDDRYIRRQVAYGNTRSPGNGW